ncbi:SPOR domain-containing protein [Trichloromonas sp.]|uniref:SPOR domain-containing protein n=1 Tax=Trichloromonas sp. TaxID=3069249 RepID=UPI002A406B51|nr:SPOR domain-containing protein [Trichloromonas sp.]
MKDDDDKDFTFGQLDDDFTSDDGWGQFDAESSKDFTLAEEGWGDDGAVSKEPPADSSPLREEDHPRRKSLLPSSRMFYYGALVMLLSAVGFYYFTSSPLPPDARSKTEPLPTKQTLEMPERPAGGSVAVGEGTSPPVAEGQVAVATEVPRGTLQEIPPAVEPETQPIGAAWSTDSTTAIQPPASVSHPPKPQESGEFAQPAKRTIAPREEKTVKAAPEPVRVASLPPAKSPEPAPQKIVTKKTTPPPKPAPEKPLPGKSVLEKSVPPAVASAGGPFVIQAGAYGETANRDQAIRKIKDLGYEAQVTPLARTQVMTRLLIGVYPPEIARAKARELEPVVPKNFTLPKGESLALYAGSYSDPNKARAAIESLAARGVSVTEERANLDTTLWRVSFGGFADKSQAETAAARARTAGLEARVLRNP